VPVQIAAARETVFRYFTDPARYIECIGSDATLEPASGSRAGAGPALCRRLEMATAVTAFAITFRHSRNPGPGNWPPVHHHDHEGFGVA